jgi:ribose-phosphate pyrophosphokinase
MHLLTFNDYLPQSKRLADTLKIPLALVESRQFPDGESLVRLPTQLHPHIVICRSLNQPNNKLIELLLCAKTARQLGAKRITLIAPYLCYMRQDIANRPGEAVSQRIIGEMLAELFDDVITVDPHLHRISTLNEAIPLKNAINVSAASAIGQYIKQQLVEGILLGPDSESIQWVSDIAKSIGFEFAVAAKVRKGDRDVSIALPERDFHDKPVIIIDDIASTGQTLTQTIRLLHQAGASDIYAVISHALFCGNAETDIREAQVKAIWSTDSIEHSTSCIYLNHELSSALLTIL